MNDTSASLISLLVTATVFTGLTVYFIYYLYKRQILHGSKLYKYVKGIKKDYEKKINGMFINVTLKSRAQFKKFSAQAYLGSDILSWNEKAQQNLKYINEINSEKEKILKSSANTFKKKIIRTECIKVLNNIKKSIPSSLTINYSYTSPKGRNYLSNSINISADKLKIFSNEYDNFKTSREFRDYQRSLVSEKLRYEILRRDGFRCKICGRTEKDGVKLHVDHIKPVARGGESVPSNLRTLCEDCNRGKSDSYVEGGLN